MAPSVRAEPGRFPRCDDRGVRRTPTPPEDEGGAGEERCGSITSTASAGSAPTMSCSVVYTPPACASTEKRSVGRHLAQLRY